MSPYFCQKTRKSGGLLQFQPDFGQSGGKCSEGGEDEFQGEGFHSPRTPHSALRLEATRGGPLRTPLGEVARRNLLQLGWNGGVCDPSTLSARRHRRLSGAGGRTFFSTTKRRGRRPKVDPKCDTTGVDKTESKRNNVGAGTTNSTRSKRVLVREQLPHTCTFLP